MLLLPSSFRITRSRVVSTLYQIPSATTNDGRVLAGRCLGTPTGGVNTTTSFRAINATNVDCPLSTPSIKEKVRFVPLAGSLGKIVDARLTTTDKLRPEPDAVPVAVATAEEITVDTMPIQLQSKIDDYRRRDRDGWFELVIPERRVVEKEFYRACRNLMV